MHHILSSNEPWQPLPLGDKWQDAADRRLSGFSHLQRRHLHATLNQSTAHRGCAYSLGCPMSSATPIAVQTLFFILGSLDEYGGRAIIENGHRVERFYANEKAVANTFKTYLRTLAQEHHLDPSIETEIEEDAGGIVFHSQALTALIDGCYSFDFATSGYMAVGPAPRRVDAYISRAVFERADREAKLSFLSGAYVRYGEGSLFRLANSRHKAEIIKELLEECGCSHVELIHANAGYIPAVFEVRFRPSAELRAWLSTFRGGAV